MNKKELYESIMRNVSIEVKKALNEEFDPNVSEYIDDQGHDIRLGEDKDANEEAWHDYSEALSWRGVPNARFIDHGEWSDPEIRWYHNDESYLINLNDLERFIFEWDVEDTRIQFDDTFDDWMDEQTTEHLEDLLLEYINTMKLEPEN